MRSAPYSKLTDAVFTIACEEGILGLYCSIVPSLWPVSHGAFQFTISENFKTRFNKNASNYKRDRKVVT